MTRKGRTPAAGKHIGSQGNSPHMNLTTSIVAGATILLLTRVFTFLSPAAAALADQPEREPETYFFGIVDEFDHENAPVPPPASEIRVDISEADAEILAKLLWSSPLTNEDDKRKLCWLVFNRIDDERYGLFGSTVDTVVIRREFTWYDRKAHVSETNIRIAREELRRWNLYLIGAVKERLLDADYLYAAFSGHHVTFKQTIGG